MEENNYDPNLWYEFRYPDGRTEWYKGDNDFVEQAVRGKMPFSVNENGEWYDAPYIEQNGNNITEHFPQWFVDSPEYQDYENNIASQYDNLQWTNEDVWKINNGLRALGDMAGTRLSFKSQAKEFGITDPVYQDLYYNNIMELGKEANATQDEPYAAQIKLTPDSDPISAADLARSFKDLDDNSRSSNMTSIYDGLAKGKSGEQTDQGDLTSKLTLSSVLNYVDDNSNRFGENNEFSGLLQASEAQKFQAATTSFMNVLTESLPIVNLVTRAIYGLGEVAAGRDFSMKIEEGNQRLLESASAGGSLEGREVSMQVGGGVGFVVNMGATLAEMMLLGNLVGGAVALASPASFIGKIGTLAQTVAGGMAYEFFLGDMPADIAIYFSDAARTGSGEKAWFNPEEEQPLFGLFGPSVPGGMAMNLAGDAVLDLLPILGIATGASFKKMDQWTNGTLSRAREKVAVGNLKVQEKLTKTPVLGKAWQKMVNHIMQPENANFIREARKASIAKNSMGYYTWGHNALTLGNHNGLTLVAPRFKEIDGKFEISATIKGFAKKAKEHGGVGEVKIEWTDRKNGMKRHNVSVVPDIMPKQVKQGLLDVERLGELKGEKQLEGDLIENKARDNEIAELEARLNETPQEIIDFAEKFSDFSKEVNKLGVEFGITDEAWFNEIKEDPRYEHYMTRQSLFPGEYGANIGAGSDPTKAKILTASRAGYYADNHIDPYLALSMKVEALGRAVAHNERKKALVAFEMAQNRVLEGVDGVKAAQRLTEVENEIKTVTKQRKNLGYDDIIGAYAKTNEAIGNSVNEINELLDLPERINIKSIYNPAQNPEVMDAIHRFDIGEIKYDSDMIGNLGLSEVDLRDIVHNTVSLEGQAASIPDNIPIDSASPTDMDLGNVGIGKDGTPYRYTTEC